MNKKYYYENSNCIILTKEAENKINNKLKDCRCKICGGSLTCITFMEGSFIGCSKDMYHKCGYNMNYGNFDKLPEIIVRNK